MSGKHVCSLRSAPVRVRLALVWRETADGGGSVSVWLVVVSLWMMDEENGQFC